MKTIKYILGLVMILGVQSCGGGGGGDEPEPTPVTPPSAASLVAPANNEECITGVEVNANQTRVNFNWSAGANATSYTIFIKDLETNSEFDTNVTGTSIDLTVNKNTPYKWWVVSKATGTTQTAKSSEWKFYNAGDAITNYAPFPADLVSPEMGSTTSSSTVTLEWSGSDVDNDISSYDVYFGTNTDPLTNSPESTTAQKIENKSVTSGSVYYWQVITKDDVGNSSTSEVFQFKTQ